MFGLFRILDEHNTARFLDRSHAEGAVGSSTRKDDSKSVTGLFGKRAKEQIDSRPLATRLVKFRSRYLIVRYLQSPVRRNHVDVVWLYFLSRLDLHNGHARA